MTKIEMMVLLPPMKWEWAVNNLTTDERRQLDDEAAHLATTTARISAYISRRMAGGDHAAAVKAQNIAARKVRQALGFTYKDDTITFYTITF